MTDIKCPCGTCQYFMPYKYWDIDYLPDRVPHNFCPKCGVKLLPGGTTGPTYAELEERVAELERDAKVGAWVGGQHCNSLCSICAREARKLELEPGNLGPCLVCDNGRFFILREDGEIDG